MTKHLAVLGSPISHSRSPQLHRAAYERLDLPWTYDAIRVGASGLRLFTGGRDEAWRGLSCTMPLKEEAYALAHERDPIAEESGAVNTLLRLPAPAGQPPRWAGFNTDVPGLAEAIRKAGLIAAEAVVLGAGATAASAVLALRMLDTRSVTVLARRSEAAQDLARRFDGTQQTSTSAPISVRAATFDTYAGGDATTVVSTLPGPAGSTVTLHPDLLAAALFDVAYDPWPSPLAQRWTDAGGASYGGLGMLIEQALLQVRIYVNGDPHAPLPDETSLLGHLYDVGMGR